MPELDPRVQDLLKRRDALINGQDPKGLEKQKAQGKLSVRERIDLFYDKDTFCEVGLFAHHHSQEFDMPGRKIPADAVVTGYGKVNGRLVFCYAQDFTLMAGSFGPVHAKKITQIMEMALQKRAPIVGLCDSSGGRIQEQLELIHSFGRTFFVQIKSSGVIPQVAAMMGPCAGGAAYTPGLADFVPMTKGIGHMFIAGPYLVEALIGEKVSWEELGGSEMHCKVSGCGDMQVENDKDCIDRIKEWLSFFPQNCEEQPPVKVTQDPADRKSEKLASIIPQNPMAPYNMLDLIREFVDDGHIMNLKGEFATSTLTVLARMGGHPVGILACNPLVKAGTIDCDGSDKMARFIRLCDAFNIPLIFIQDNPGFMIGSRIEKQGIIRHGAKMLYAVAEASVPKVTVIVRKAYAGAFYAMCSKDYDPDLIVAWPTAEISLMGPDGAISIIFRKQLASAENPAELKAKLKQEYVDKYLSPYPSAEHRWIDDVIDPRETRSVIIKGIEMARNKHVDWPWRKHGNIPL